MDIQSIQNDLNTILDDLEPQAQSQQSTPPGPTETSTEQTATSEVKNISTEEVVTKLKNIQHLTQELLDMLQNTPVLPMAHISAHTSVFRTNNTPVPQFLTQENGAAVLEGHFNGEKMIGDDGKEYNVPPNYASKSKLVTGDRMKLTITHSGAFIYKQIGPINRKRVIGTLEFNPEHNHWTVRGPEATYKVLAASISFYKGKPGDEVILFVPESTPCEWAAVDQLIAK